MKLTIHIDCLKMIHKIFLIKTGILVFKIFIETEPGLAIYFKYNTNLYEYKMKFIILMGLLFLWLYYVFVAFVILVYLFKFYIVF